MVVTKGIDRIGYQGMMHLSYILSNYIVYVYIHIERRHVGIIVENDI